VSVCIVANLPPLLYHGFVMSVGDSRNNSDAQFDSCVGLEVEISVSGYFV
jgi:hypothetical protein